MRRIRNLLAIAASSALIGAGAIVAAVPAQAATVSVVMPNGCTGGFPTVYANASGGDTLTISGLTSNCNFLSLPSSNVDDSIADVTIANGTLGSPVLVGGVVLEYPLSSVGASTTISVVLNATATGELARITRPGTGGAIVRMGSAPNPNPNPPTPTPAVPPSAPASAEATAGNGEVTVSWAPPTSQGSFPITNYQVQSTSGNLGCLVPVTATSCRVAGLRNGTAYTFQVRALNGGGWGSWATTESVTPRPEPEPEASIMITGSRSGNDRVARVQGETTGLSGATLQAMVRLSTQTEFAAGSTRVVNAQGGFTWQRRTNATVTVEVYFTAGDISSNTVTIAGR